jgi:hypothetical protein
LFSTNPNADNAYFLQRYLLHADYHPTEWLRAFGNGAILWANTHLIFWLSLFPFATGWIGKNHLAPTPTAAYGFVLFMAAIAYYILERTIISQQGRDSPLAKAVGRDWKAKISTVLYLLAIPLSFVSPWIGSALYVFVALMWIIPDPRIEGPCERMLNEASFAHNLSGMLSLATKYF